MDEAAPTDSFFESFDAREWLIFIAGPKLDT